MSKSRKVNGFTLTEIMITLVILGILAAIAIPAYFRTVEQSRSNEAITNLNIIHMAEKISRLNASPQTFWGPGATTIAAINTALNTDIGATFYDTVSVSITGTTQYTARLTRNAVSGGNGTDYYQYAFTDGNAAPTCTKTGAVVC